jgi:hypothetical protein
LHELITNPTMFVRVDATGVQPRTFWALDILDTVYAGALEPAGRGWNLTGCPNLFAHGLDDLEYRHETAHERGL